MLGGGAVAAAIAFIAFGANFLSAALLLLFNPRSRAVRWYVLFMVSQLIWLLLQGLLILEAVPPRWSMLYAINLHFMPALFFAATLVQVNGERARWLPYIPIAVAAATMLLFTDFFNDSAVAFWHAIGWGVPAILHARQRLTQPRSRSAHVLNLILTTVVPFGVIGAIMLAGGFVLYVLPLMTVLIQLLIFTGVVYHSFYDIEVRAARTGALAAAAAEHDRLALLGELAATVAHEVRNPLTGIRSLAQRMGEEPLDAERRARYSDVILHEISRLDRIVGNLTGLARQTSVNGGNAAQLTPLTTLFEDLQLLVESRAKRAGVTVVFEPTELAVRTSREALAQALLNLLLNAIAHAPANSIVQLTAVRAHHGVSVRVRDHGPGIPADQRARIFEPFRSSSGGTGLGLAVVRRLASEHGWTVDVAADVEPGAEFRVLIPGDVPS